MTQGAIGELQSRANRAWVREKAGLVCGLECMATALGVHWIHSRGTSLAKAVALDVLGGAVGMGAIFGCDHWLQKDPSWRPDERVTLDPTDPKVGPYLPYCPGAYANVDPKKLQLTVQEIKGLNKKVEDIKAGDKKIWDLGESLLPVVLGISALSLLAAVAGRLAQGFRYWQSAAALGAFSTPIFASGLLLYGLREGLVAERLEEQVYQTGPAVLLGELSKGEVSNDDYDLLWRNGTCQVFPSLDDTQFKNLQASYVTIYQPKAPTLLVAQFCVRDQSQLTATVGETYPGLRCEIC